MNIDLHGFGPAMMAGTDDRKTGALRLCWGWSWACSAPWPRPHKPLQWLGGFTTLVRGVPAAVGAAHLFRHRHLMNSLGEALGMPGLELSAFAAGVIALGLCFGAYATEVFRGAILAIPKGHREAGLAWACQRPHPRGSSCRRCGASPCRAWATCS
jgi:polar amino acid transport system permease protein